jgi:hypothetical protein
MCGSGYAVPEAVIEVILGYAPMGWRCEKSSKRAMELCYSIPKQGHSPEEKSDGPGRA